MHSVKMTFAKAKSESSALFLLNNGADPNIKSSNNEAPIAFAVKQNLGKVVEILCVRGADKQVRVLLF